MKLCIPKISKDATLSWTSDSLNYMPTNPYTLTESSDKVSNIPYDDYILDTTPDYSNSIDITYFGASTTNSAKENTIAIQNALNYASINGLTLTISSLGVYMCGTLSLPSNTSLFIAKDATLKSIDYENNQKENILSDKFIKADNASNINIYGGGTIDGNYKRFFNEAKDPSFKTLTTFNLKERVLRARDRILEPKGNRAFLLYFSHCENISINGIILTNSAHWTCVFNNSNSINVSNMIIDNNFYVAQSDGIDIESSSNVKIDHCFIVTGDDGLCIKTLPDNEVKNIEITNCSVMSMANNFKIGTQTERNVTNVIVKDCFFFTSEIMGGYAGIAIQSADGAHVSDITCENINMVGVTSPLLIWLGNRCMGENKLVGSIQNITIKNINSDFVDLPMAIVGCKSKGKTYNVTKVSLDNIAIRYRNISENLNILYPVPRFSASGYPEITRVSHLYIINHKLSGYWDLPYYGLYARDYDNISSNNINIKPRNTNSRPCTNLSGLSWE